MYLITAYKAGRKLGSKLVKADSIEAANEMGRAYALRKGAGSFVTREARA